MTQSLPNASNPSGSKIIGLGRLPFRVDPLEIESARGYISRVAQIYSTSVSALGELLGLTQMLGLERGDNTEQIAYALRLEASEWRRLCYKQTNAKGQYGPTSFFGELIGGDRLNYGFPRVCRVLQRTRRGVGRLGPRFGLRLSDPSLRACPPLSEVRTETPLAEAESPSMLLPVRFEDGRE